MIGSITRPRFAEQACAPSGTNYGVIAKAARDLLQDPPFAAKFYEVPIETYDDLVEATKRLCARKGIDYGRRDPVPFDIVHRACTSEWLKFTHPEIVSGEAARPRDRR